MNGFIEGTYRGTEGYRIKSTGNSKWYAPLKSFTPAWIMTHKINVTGAPANLLPLRYSSVTQDRMQLGAYAGRGVT